MAFSLPALFSGMARGRTAYLGGKREQEAANAEAERQRRLDTFNEYARSRQLAQTDNAQENAMERASLQAQNALERQGLINEAKERDAAARKTIEDQKRQIDWFNAKSRYGTEGDQQKIGQPERMNNADNEAMLQGIAARAAAAAATAAAKGGANGGLTPYQRMAQENRLKKDSQTELRPHALRAQGLAQIQAAYKQAMGNPNDAQADQGLIYGIVKMLDPESAVRDGERATLEKSMNISQEIRSTLMRWVGPGRRMPDEVRNHLMDLARNIATEQRGLARSAMEFTAMNALEYGIPSERVVRDPYADLLGKDVGNPAGKRPTTGARPTLEEGLARLDAKNRRP
jgi:hypothetical protein